jgi:hypothetical protein
MAHVIPDVCHPGNQPPGPGPCDRKTDARGSSDRHDQLPTAHLDPLVYQSLPNANTQLQLYATWEQAVNDLLEGLARMQALLEKPKDV